MLRILVAVLITLCWALGAWAAEVEVTLSGGEVVGSVRGQGTASVTAGVVNRGDREVTGLRIAVFYNTVDRRPADPDAADWRIHEFVFEPPLQPGKSTTLSFTDSNAAEYILIEVRYIAAGLGLTYNGRAAVLDYPLELRDGVSYIATRDLVSLIGGGLSYDAATYEVVLERQGSELRFKGNGRQVRLNGAAASLEHAIIEVDGRSFLPLADCCTLLGITVSHDSTANLIILSDG